MNTEAVTVGFAGLDRAPRAPAWAARRFAVSSKTVAEFCQETELPGVVVVSASSYPRLAAHREQVQALHRHAQQAHSQMVLKLDRAKADRVGVWTEVLRLLDAPTRVELAVGAEQLESSVEEALAKRLVETERAAPRRREIPEDPLAELQSVIEVTRHLRAESGRLSAAKIAELFGIPLAQLARWIGKERATVHKTPDAPALQPLLRPFERVARVRAALASDDRFRSWLNHSFYQLDDLTPLEAIDRGHLDAIADFAEDALTGTPSS